MPDRDPICNFRHGNLSALQSKLQKQSEKISEYQEDIEKNKGFASEWLKEIDALGKKLDNSRAAALQASKKHKKEIEAVRKEGLHDLKCMDIINFLASKIREEDPESLDEEGISILYAALYECVPDITRVKELALIPHEVLRAKQVELIVENFSRRITEVENSDLSDREKNDKISVYRAARERELGITE